MTARKMSTYAYRPRAGEKSPRSPQKYFSRFDRFVVLLGLAAAVALLGDAVATHGQSAVAALQHAFGIH